jgi:hypothetical protein
MTSYSGGTTGTVGQDDPTLQLAPAENKGPAFAELKAAFDQCLSDNASYEDQTAANYDTRYALWSGQTSDGKKHTREGDKIDPTPWDGASDLRVFLTDEAINSKVAMLCTAFRRANVVAVPIEGNDLKRAKTVSNFMRWLVQTQIPEIDREVELLAQYLQEKGLAVTGQFWEEVKETTLVTLTVEQLQEQLPDYDLAALLADPEARDMLQSLFETTYGCTGRKAKKMLAELEVRAFNLDEDLFIPASATDIEHAPAIYRVQWFSPEQLRCFVHTDGWDQNWVDAAIERCRGKAITNKSAEMQQPRARSMLYQDVSTSNLIGVVFAYQRLSDEDGYAGIYLSVFNPMLPEGDGHEGYAKYGLLGYAHGRMPFVLHRREFLSRRLHDSRGVPEAGKPIQDMIK